MKPSYLFKFINIDINNYLDSILKELKQSLENGEFVKNKNIKLMAMILFSDIDAFSSFFIRNLFPPLKATIILYHLLADLSNLTFLLFSR